MSMRAQENKWMNSKYLSQILETGWLLSQYLLLLKMLMKMVRSISPLRLNHYYEIVGEEEDDGKKYWKVIDETQKEVLIDHAKECYFYDLVKPSKKVTMISSKHFDNLLYNIQLEYIVRKIFVMIFLSKYIISFITK